MVTLDVVHRLPRGDLGQFLAGAPQLPCDLARTHLRIVEEEEEVEEDVGGGGGGERGKKKREVKGNEGGKKGGGI